MTLTQDMDRLLEDTLSPRPPSARRPKPLRRGVLPGFFSAWAKSQVTAYRLGLVLSYVATTGIGAVALVNGIPAFEITTPEWWTLIWSLAVILGGVVAAVGAIHAGETPSTLQVRTFNRIELAGSIALFLAMTGYAAVLLVLGYGYGDTSRASSGAVFVALGVAPAVRMVWLIFRHSGRD